MGLEIRLAIEPLRSIAGGSITAGYIGIGTSFAHPIRIFEMWNLTDAVVLLSDDGINDKWVLPSGGYRIVDVCTNRTVSQQFYLPEGTRIYVKQLGIPVAGSVYITAYYGAS